MKYMTSCQDKETRVLQDRFMITIAITIHYVSIIEQIGIYNLY